MSKIIIGTRGSILALWQANFVKQILESRFNLECELKIVKTKGDVILDSPLSKIGQRGLFTKELEDLLIKNEITLAVHSLKDVPINLNDDLILCSITKRADSRDCFLSNLYPDIASLPFGARVGTSSLRRSMQLKYIRNDINTLNLRGNIQTRLSKLHNGDFDAIILAKAGVDRLGIDENDIKFILPLDSYVMIPAMGQGALGIECRKDCKILEELKSLNDSSSATLCGIERRFIGLLNGGCQVPIGVNATYLSKDLISLNAIIGLPNGDEVLQDCVSGRIEDDLALQLFNILDSNGAKELLQKALSMASNLGSKYG